MGLIAAWARAFVLTLAVELCVATPLLARVDPRLWRRLAVVAIAQVVSHPAVWFIFTELRVEHSTYLVLAESWAVVSELVVYRVVFPDLPWLRAFGVSALANGASYALGEILYAAHVL